MEITNQAMNKINEALNKHKERLIVKEIKKLLKKLGIEHMYAVDGCDITLRESTRGKFPNKGAGRNKADGTSAAPAIKIHVVFDVVNHNFKSIDITEGVADERQHLHLEFLAGSMFIADRGYISEDLEWELIQNKTTFIIKGKKNMTS